MNKNELIAKVNEKTGFKADKAVNALLDIIVEALAKGDNVQILGFGTFKTRERAARTGHNPHTGETIQIPASVTAAFKPGKALKAAVNK